MPDAKLGMGMSAGGGTRRERWIRRSFPTVEDLRLGAKRRIPGFAFEYADCGVGLDLNVKANRAALDAVQLVPRTGRDRADTSIEVELFGRRYAAPIGIAPMGLPSMIWPGAELVLGKAAQRARIPYTVGCVGGCAVERIGEVAGDVLWFQLYRIARDDHQVGVDLIRRAEEAGAHVLVLTVDLPTRSKRPREMKNRLAVPFQPGVKTIWEVLTSPAWLMALLRNGEPDFENMKPYVGPSRGAMADFITREMLGSFTWEEVKRYRDLWKGPMIVKGIMHPEDALAAIKVGFDGIQVSNHGGRQFEAAPAAIDVLPAIAEAAGGKATVLFDSGVRSGIDVLRVLALGGQAALAGRPFLYALAALGDDGGDYVLDLLLEEIRTAVRQAGLHTVADAPLLEVRHPGALQF
jgi:isopentenyl diphosphate isomerase/L-lactate dehydrogenase-like FMN-dependent dehydrogenase